MIFSSYCPRLCCYEERYAVPGTDIGYAAMLPGNTCSGWVVQLQVCYLLRHFPTGRNQRHLSACLVQPVLNARFRAIDSGVPRRYGRPLLQQRSVPNYLRPRSNAFPVQIVPETRVSAFDCGADVSYRAGQARTESGVKKTCDECTLSGSVSPRKPGQDQTSTVSIVTSQKGLWTISVYALVNNLPIHAVGSPFALQVCADIFFQADLPYEFVLEYSHFVYHYTDPAKPPTVPVPDPVPDPAKPPTDTVTNPPKPPTDTVTNPAKPSTVTDPPKPPTVPVPDPAKPPTDTVTNPAKPSTVTYPAKLPTVPDPPKPSTVTNPAKLPTVPDPPKPSTVTYPAKLPTVPDPPLNPKP
eukprot:3941974-Rhodomonas_salina.3